MTLFSGSDVTHFGKLYFVYGGSADSGIQNLYTNGRTDLVVFIVRPDEAREISDKITVLRKNYIRRPKSDALSTFVKSRATAFLVWQ